MKLLSFFRKEEEKDNRIKRNSVDKELFGNVINNANYILKNSSADDEIIHPIFTFIKQFTDLISHETAINSYIDGNYHPDDIIPFIFEGIICSACDPEIRRIEITDKENDLLKKMNNYFIYKKDIYMDLSVFPLILNPWNSKRISENILHVATKDNPFDKDKYSYNLNNYYYYPTGVGQCFGGNHSQYSSKLKGKGNTSIRFVNDISQVYDVVSFDGINFYCATSTESYKSSNFEIYKCKNKLEFYSGLLFEIGRLMLDYPEIFPEKIREAVSQ